MTENNFIDTEQLATRWGISKHTLQAWRFKKKGPEFTRKGFRKVVYRMEDVERFERDNPGILANVTIGNAVV